MAGTAYGTVIRAVTHGGGTAPSPASAKIMNANPRRLYAEIINASDTGMWIKLGAAAVVGEGIFIAPNGFAYVMDGNNLWQGEIYMICASTGKAYGTIEGQ